MERIDKSVHRPLSAVAGIIKILSDPEAFFSCVGLGM